MGPAGLNGLNGEDGLDGKDGEVTCLSCHSDANLQSIRNPFTLSSHYAGHYDKERYEEGGGSWSSSCVSCHTSPGFIDFTMGATAVAATNPTGGFKCETCHGIHKTFETTDYALRVTSTSPFIAASTVTADFGTANLCASCHQNRTAAPIADGDGNFKITSTHYGPHHGPQANLLYGIGFAEVAGTKPYPAQGSATHMKSSSLAGKCVSCHMSSYGNGAGGHTFKPGLDACTSCHTGATNFDVNGFQTEVQDKLDEIRDILVNAGVMSGNDVDGYHVNAGTYAVAYAQAYFNWIGISEDRSLGVHNQTYVTALLDNSIDAITPN
jgi:hypothetical protein